MKIVAFCIECNKDAKWVRSTQFSGEHAYCKKHARKQKDFKHSDGSYFYWHKVNREPHE